MEERITSMTEKDSERQVQQIYERLLKSEKMERISRYWSWPSARQVGLHMLVAPKIRFHANDGGLLALLARGR